MGKGGAAVVLQRAKLRIGAVLVTGLVQVGTRIIAAQVVAVRSNCAGVIVDICARSSGVQNRVADRKRRAAVKTEVVDAAAVGGGRITAQSAVGYRQRRAAGVAEVEDAAAVVRRVAAEGTVVDRHRRAAEDAVVEDAAAVVGGRITAQSAFA